MHTHIHTYKITTVTELKSRPLHTKDCLADLPLKVLADPWHHILHFLQDLPTCSFQPEYNCYFKNLGHFSHFFDYHLA